MIAQVAGHGVGWGDLKELFLHGGVLWGTVGCEPSLGKGLAAENIKRHFSALAFPVQEM